MDNFSYTIIIPHYNIPDLLIRCLKSIPERSDIQVIVVDDCSDNCDSYVECIPELKRSNVEFYITRDKKGAGHVRNVALPYIKGRKVIFADADDFFVDDFSLILDEFANDESDLIYFNTRSCLSDDVSVETNRTKDDLFSLFLETGSIEHFKYQYTEPWGKIYSAELIQNNHIVFDETIVANDQMFSLKTAYAAKKIKLVNRPLYVVTTRCDSLSFKSIDTVEKLCARLDVCGRSQVFLSRRGVSFYPMYVFGLMVNLAHRNFTLFIKYLVKFQVMGIPAVKLLWQIFVERVISPQKRQKRDVEKSYYEKK